MSRKKQQRNIVTAKPNPIKETAPYVPADAPLAVAAPANPPTADGMPLLAEVQSFIQRREELAKKLADEITATESKLAELKRTAAALFPENAVAAPAANKEKKAKKLPKAKPLPAKGEVTATASDIKEVEPAANETAS